jgi:hypothetical protein
MRSLNPEQVRGCFSPNLNNRNDQTKVAHPTRFRAEPSFFRFQVPDLALEGNYIRNASPLPPTARDSTFGPDQGQTLRVRLRSRSQGKSIGDWKPIYVRDSTMKRIEGAVAGIVVLAMAMSAPAQTVIAPTTAEVTGAASNVLFRNLDASYMEYFDPTQLASITTPVEITGMQFRFPQKTQSGVANPWPAVDLVSSNFTVELSRVNQATLNPTTHMFTSVTGAFANYQGTGVTTVRTGPLSILTGSYVNNGAATISPFGPIISFSTPYEYDPGEDMLMYIMRSQVLDTGGNNVAGAVQFAAITSLANVGDDVFAAAAGANAATNATGRTSPYFVEFSYTPISVPEPGSLLMAGVPALGAIGAWWRRRSQTRLG